MFLRLAVDTRPPFMNMRIELQMRTFWYLIQNAAIVAPSENVRSDQETDRAFCFACDLYVSRASQPPHRLHDRTHTAHHRPEVAADPCAPASTAPAVRRVHAAGVCDRSGRSRSHHADRGRRHGQPGQPAIPLPRLPRAQDRRGERRAASRVRCERDADRSRAPMDTLTARGARGTGGRPPGGRSKNSSRSNGHPGPTFFLKTRKSEAGVVRRY